MAYEHKIDAMNEVAFLSFIGTVAGAELAQAKMALYRDPSWQNNFHAIWDFTLVTGMAIEWEDLRALINIDRSRPHVAGSGKDLLVVWRKVDEAMGKIHAQLSKGSPRPSSVFRSLTDAWTSLYRN